MSGQDHTDLMNEIQSLRAEVKLMMHGSRGDPGLRAVVMDMYGDESRQRRGLMARTDTLEKGVERLISTRRENNRLLWGILIGVGVLTIDSVFGLNIPARLAAILGLA